MEQVNTGFKDTKVLETEERVDQSIIFVPESPAALDLKKKHAEEMEKLKLEKEEETKKFIENLKIQHKAEMEELGKKLELTHGEELKQYKVYVQKQIDELKQISENKNLLEQRMVVIEELVKQGNGGNGQNGGGGGAGHVDLADVVALVNQVVTGFQATGCWYFVNKSLVLTLMIIILWVCSWSLIFINLESPLTKWISSVWSATQVFNTCSAGVAFVISVTYMSRSNFVFGERMRLGFTVCFFMLAMLTEGHFIDMVSVFFSIGMAIISIPISFLLNMEDDMGMFEAFIKPADDALKAMGYSWYFMLVFTLVCVYSKRGIVRLIKYLCA